MPLRRLWALMNWARAETRRRGQTLEELLNYLREEIRKQVVGRTHSRRRLESVNRAVPPKRILLFSICAAHQVGQGTISFLQSGFCVECLP